MCVELELWSLEEVTDPRRGGTTGEEERSSRGRVFEREGGMREGPSRIGVDCAVEGRVEEESVPAEYGEPVCGSLSETCKSGI